MSQFIDYSEYKTMNKDGLGPADQHPNSSPDQPTTDIPLRNAVRNMLLMATEGAFALRSGQPSPAYLDRFADQGDRLANAVTGAGTDNGSTDFQFLVTRAQNTLSAFRNIVRQEIAERIDRETSNQDFDQALETIKDAAVAAGAAVACLEMALRNR